MVYIYYIWYDETSITLTCPGVLDPILLCSLCNLNSSRFSSPPFSNLVIFVFETEKMSPRKLGFNGKDDDGNTSIFQNIQTMNFVLVLKIATLKI